jgi:tetratricopeptide (TPR) repeat protein
VRNCYVNEKPNLAVKDLRFAISQKPVDEDVQTALKAELINGLIEIGELEKAKSYCKQLRQSPPSRAYAFGKMGDIFSREGNRESAIKEYSKAIALEKENPVLLCMRGKQLLDLDRYEAAIEDFSQALEIDPEHASAYYNRGNAYAQLDELLRAVKDYTEVLNLQNRISPRLVSQALLNRGQIHCKMKDYEQAIKDLTQCLKIDQENINAFLFRGFAFLALHKFVEAITDLEKAYQGKNKLENQRAKIPLSAAHFSLAYEMINDDTKKELQAGKIVYHLIQAVNLNSHYKSKVTDNPKIIEFLQSQNLPLDLESKRA